MSGSVALDVFIGLVFIYLLYSLFVTIIGEMVATWLGIRARILRVAIERMLNDGHNANNQITQRSPFEQRLGNSAVGRFVLRIRHWFLRFMLYEFEEFKYSFAGRFYYQPSVKYLGTGPKPQAFSFRHSKPAYFSAETFAETLIHLLRSKGTGATDMERVQFCLRFNTMQIEPDTIEYLRNLAADSGNDLTIFSEKLKGWFEETMDRANGWYKRKLQFILFWLGFIVVAAFNVDTIRIASKLAKDEVARDQMVRLAIRDVAPNSSIEQAVQQIEQGRDSTDREKAFAESYRAVKSSIDDANKIIGLGWDTTQARKMTFSFLGKQRAYHHYHHLNPFRIEFWGIIITALALTLGAPFWFDLLRKLISIRGTGVNPDEENRVNKIQGSQATPVRGAVNANPVAVPVDEAPAGDIIEEAIRVYGPKIRQIPGVRAVLKGLSNGVRCVQVNVLDGLTRQEVERQFAALQVGGIALAPVVVVTGVPVTQQATKGTISNKSGLNSFGSVGCVLQHKVTGSRHLLSCWHVMKGNLRYDQDDNARTIVDKHNKDVAIRWAGGISGAFDFALAECLSNSLSNSNLFQALGFQGGRYRPVTDVDVNTQIKVRYYDSIKNKIRDGKIYTDTPSVSIRYADNRFRDVEDLLVLTNDSSGTEITISQPGNSGSVVFDREGFAIGMIIAGDNQYTYAIKLSNVFDLYTEMEII